LRVLIAVAPERVRVEVAAEPEGAVAGLPRRRLLSLLLIDGVVRHDVAMLVPVFMSVAMRLPAVGVARQLPDGSEAREGDEYACGEGNHGMILRQRPSIILRRGRPGDRVCVFAGFRPRNGVYLRE